MILNRTSNRESQYLDLNKILRFLNLLIISLAWFLFFYSKEPNQFVGFNTLCIGSILTIQVHLFLYIERRRRDPFVLIVCLQIVLYYSLRLLTLLIHPHSLVLERFPFTQVDMNKTLEFIIVINFALYSGLYLNKSKPIREEVYDNYPTNPGIIVLVLLFVNFMTFAQSFGFSAFQVILALVNNLFFNIFVVIIMVMIYREIVNNKIAKRYKIVFILGLLSYIVFSTLVGSRSAIVVYFYLILISSLGIYNYFKIKKSYIVSLTLLVPVMVVIFAVSTFIRPRLQNRLSISSETFKVIKEFNVKDFMDDDPMILLGPVFERIGFLDYAAEIITNHKKYEPVINPIYFIESVIDNVLTPGFDVFGIPKSANALKFIYEDVGEPRKDKVSESYQSDELTIYGEAYCLMGKWFSVIPIFFIGFFFKRVYVKIDGKNYFSIAVKRTLVIWLFYSYFNSFGIDWLLLDVVGVSVTFLIFSKLFKFKMLAPGNIKYFEANEI